MRIAILVTCLAWKPSGGLRVIYNYAERLANEGHQVSLYYASYSNIEKQTIWRKAKRLLKHIYFTFIGDYRCTSWYNLDPRIGQSLIWKISDNAIAPADAYMATTMQSAYGLDKMKVDNKFYFIQGFENWEDGVTDEMVYNTYHFPMRKIVIADWLKRIVESVNESCEVVYNGFNNKRFRINQGIASRDKHTICMMYSDQETKGCQDCFNALAQLKKTYPALKVNVFGVPKRPENLPDWYNYTQKPSQEKLVDIYNSAAIFINASHTEGWGLTVGEAMLCGCAVACSNNDGHCEMAKNEETALLSDIKDWQQLADNVARLIKDDQFRQKIAENGNQFLQNFNVEDSFEKFKNILLG